MSECIFCKIVTRAIPAHIVYSDEEIIVFKDIHPKAEVHWLIIPVRHIGSTLEITAHDQNLLGKMLVVGNQLAIEHGLDQGYKLQINTGINGGQEVAHLHIHLLGNR